MLQLALSRALETAAMPVRPGHDNAKKLQNPRSSVVLLPQPLGPSRDTIRPSSNLKGDIVYGQLLAVAFRDGAEFQYRHGTLTYDKRLIPITCPSRRRDLAGC